MQTEKEYYFCREISAMRCESAGEYSLPDYNGDVRKVLALNTKVFPSGKFVGEDSLEFSGTVEYEVVYVDSDNNITHTCFSTDYDGFVRINSSDYVDSSIRTCVAACSLRLLGPRKISVKCSLDNDIEIKERRVYSIDGDAFDEYEPEVMTEEIGVKCSDYYRGDNKKISEELISIEGAISDEVEVLLCDVQCDLNNISRVDGSLKVNGVLRALVLYKNGDEAVRTLNREIDLCDELTLDGLMEYDDISVSADLVEAKATVVPTDEGVTIIFSSEYTPSVSANKNVPLSVISDAYLKERGCENEYSNLSYTEHICVERYREGFEKYLTFPELSLEKIDDVIYCTSSVRADSCEFVDEGVRIDGEIRFSGIACQVSEDSGTQYLPIKISLPFTQNVNYNGHKSELTQINCSVSTSNAKMICDENGVNISSEIFIKLSFSDEKIRRALTASYLTDEEYMRDESVVTVYYPDESETLYSVAKKFHTSTRTIAEDNRLTETVFSSLSDSVTGLGVKKLVIR